MMTLRYLLVADGSSDRMLLDPIDWLLGRYGEVPFEGSWADPRGYRTRPKTLSDRLNAALAAYRCDLLFVHRDAEREPRARRVEEISAALENFDFEPPAVCVVPVRMTEAWFLFDETAIRRAAGNPNASVSLDLPEPKRVEAIADPKTKLLGELERASGLSGRRRKKFSPEIARSRIGDFIDDFSALDAVPAFRALREDLIAVLESRGWLRREHIPRIMTKDVP